MNDWLSLIGTVGFPICACVAVGLVLYKFLQKWQLGSEEREKALLKVINEQRQAQQNKTLQRIADTLESILVRLENMEDRKSEEKKKT